MAFKKRLCIIIAIENEELQSIRQVVYATEFVNPNSPETEKLHQKFLEIRNMIEIGNFPQFDRFELKGFRK
jgi:hypothetical protein